VAIVTGSSSGIGKSIALRMAREGAAVCVVANHNVQGGETTALEISDGGGASLFVHADVSVAADCKRIVDETIETLGRVDVLVNNAGITLTSPLEDMEEEFWDTVLDTNLKSAYLLSRLAVADMLPRAKGSIVNISSVHAQSTFAEYAAYAASKAGMCGMTRALACEFGSRGVRFNCILPGTTDISLYPFSNEEVNRAAWKPRFSEVQVMKRWGSPDEVAAAACFLASDEASYVNGATLAVDGGMLCVLKDR
jgi:glucose 1-dehydrogenase